MKDIFESSKASLWHAKRRNMECDIEFTKWIETDPCATITEPYGDGIHEVQKLKLVKPVPKWLGLYAFDALNSLRMALDQASYAVATASGADGDHAHFPFGNSAKDVIARTRNTQTGSARDIPQSVFDVIMQFEPYKGGDNFLCAMNRICNSHKHEAIVTTAMAIGQLNMGGSSHPDLRIRAPLVWDRKKNEIELFIFPIGAKIEYQFTFNAFVCFADVDIAKDMAIGSFFNIVMSHTESIVTAIQAEASRIGLMT